MTERDIIALFVTLSGYWPTSAPSPDDRVALAAHLSVLEGLSPTVVLAAVKRLSADGERFCPPPGVIAAACKPVVTPPYHEPYKPELPPAPEDLSDVPAMLAEARQKLRDRGPGVSS